MLKQVVTFSIHPRAKEVDLLEFVSKKIWPKFDPAKCSLAAWRTDPETQTACPRYRFEVIYFDEPEWKELGKVWADVWGSENIMFYVGSFYSFETYWYMRKSSLFNVPGFSGTRTACVLNNCPRNVNTGSAPSCSAKPQHVFCDHRLVNCPKCPPGSTNPVK